MELENHEKMFNPFVHNFILREWMFKWDGAGAGSEIDNYKSRDDCSTPCSWFFVELDSHEFRERDDILTTPVSFSSVGVDEHTKDILPDRNAGSTEKLGKTINKSSGSLSVQTIYTTDDEDAVLGMLGTFGGDDPPFFTNDLVFD